MKTVRIQENHLMKEEEKKAYTQIIRNLPWLYAPILNTLKRYAKNSSSLLDIACGDGYLLYLISKKHPTLKLKGIDADSYMITKAKKDYSFEFYLENAESSSKKADIIICNLALHHFKEPIPIIKKLQKKCKTLIISDQIRPKTEEELDKAIKKREKIIGNNDRLFYKENERESILEAYSKQEIKELFKNFNSKITFFDEDYYERVVVVIE